MVLKTNEVNISYPVKENNPKQVAQLDKDNVPANQRWTQYEANELRYKINDANNTLALLTAQSSLGDLPQWQAGQTILASQQPYLFETTVVGNLDDTTNITVKQDNSYYKIAEI